MLERQDKGWWLVRFASIPEALTHGETPVEAWKPNTFGPARDLQRPRTRLLLTCALPDVRAGSNTSVPWRAQQVHSPTDSTQARRTTECSRRKPAQKL